MNKKILISTNNFWAMWNFRKELLQRLILEGFEIYAAAKYDGYETKVANLGVITVDLGVSGFDISLIQELNLIFKYFKLFLLIKPLYYLSFTIRPNIYGGIIAKIFNVKSLINVAGAGDAFSRSGLKFFIARCAYRLAVNSASHVFFQNSNDKKLLSGGKDIKKVSLLPGSGVDLEKFRFQKLSQGPKLKLLYMGRFLKEKGLGELVASVEMLNRMGHPVQLKIVGFAEANDDRYFQIDELSELINTTAIKLHPKTDDPMAYYYWSDVVVLPTYYNEGTPRSLLEAAACGRILVATKRPGCDRIVVDEENGFLVEPRSSDSLYDALLKVLKLSNGEMNAYARRSRSIVEEQFSVNIICDQYLNIIKRN